MNDNDKRAAYKVLARHFADNQHVGLVFEDKACPSTDNKTIVLPDRVNPEYANRLLGALLHETGHIKNSIAPDIAYRNCSKLEQFCINALEDIRIDNITLSNYPNSKSLSVECLTGTIEENRALMVKEPLPVKLLKGVIMCSEDVDPGLVYEPAETEVIKKYAGYADKAKACNNTQELKKVALEMVARMREEGLTVPDDKIKMEQVRELSRQIQEAPAKADIKRGEIEEMLSNRSEEELKELAEAKEKQKKIQRKRRLNRTNLEKMKQVPGITQEKLDKQTKKCERLDKKDQKAIKEISDKEYQAGFKEREINQAKSEMSELETAIHRKIREIEKLESMGESDEGIILVGFQSLNTEKLTQCPEVFIPEEPPQELSEVIKDKLIFKRDIQEPQEDGNILNEARLASAIVDPEDEQMFTNPVKRDRTTQVAIILDGSGSMGHYTDDNTNSMTICLNLGKVIGTELLKAKEEGAPVDFSIWGFATKAVEVVDTADNFQEDTLVSQFVALRDSIGTENTNLAATVNRINETMKEKLGGDKIAVVITDAAINSEQLSELRNYANMDSTKFYWIAINNNFNRPEVQELFGDYKIFNFNDGLEMVKRILIAS